MAATKTTLPAVRHEDWCQPTGDRDEVRIEQYIAYRDDEKTGRSIPAVRVTRCMECGESKFEEL